MRTIEEKTYDLIIAGAGPVGLLAGVLACRHGLDVLILEKLEKPLIHSRSIGIHPPSLRIFSDAGLLDAFLEKGLMIRRGQAISHRHTALGLLDIY
ncbi:MAG: FAD-dependent monooxygenase, partial [Bacteroidota bacterium]